MRPGLILGMFYAVGVTCLVLWRASFPGSITPSWTAAHALDIHHQIQAVDLKGPHDRYRQAQMIARASLVGRHLKKPKRAGEPISVADTVAEPTYELGDPGSRVAIYRLKEDQYLAQAVARGHWVVPCFTRVHTSATRKTETQCGKLPVFVEAVHRPVTASDNNWLALRLSRCQITEIGEYLAREHRFVMLAPAPTLSAGTPCDTR